MKAISAVRLATIHKVDDSTAVGTEYVRMLNKIRDDRIGQHGDRFLGFLSGRLRITPPEWWIADLRGGDVGLDRNVWFGSQRIQRRAWGPHENRWGQLRRLWGESEQGVLFSGVDSVVNNGDKLKMQLDGTVIGLTKSDFDDPSSKNLTVWTPNDLSGGIASTFAGEFSAVPFGCTGGCKTVAYGDTKTGRVLWIAKPEPVVTAGGNSGDWTGAFTELIIDDDRVWVYGTHIVGMSLQAFDRKTGKMRFLFTSQFLDDVTLN